MTIGRRNSPTWSSTLGSGSSAAAAGRAPSRLVRSNETERLIFVEGTAAAFFRCERALPLPNERARTMRREKSCGSEGAAVSPSGACATEVGLGIARCW